MMNRSNSASFINIMTNLIQEEQQKWIVYIYLLTIAEALFYNEQKR
jgi:hypothetical protein